MPADPNQPEIAQSLSVRTYEARDQKVVSDLYTNGMLFGGHVAPNDTGADIEYIRDEYLSDPRCHFWVAEMDGKVVGMIGVAAEEQHTAEIRRLRVDPAFQDTPIAQTLLTTAIDHCRHHNYLKVRLDTRFEQDQALDLFQRIGFQHNRTRSVQNKDLLEFYFDIYRKPDED